MATSVKTMKLYTIVFYLGVICLWLKQQYEFQFVLSI